MSNPDGHSPKYWRRHPKAPKQTAEHGEMPDKLRFQWNWFKLAPRNEAKSSRTREIVVGLASDIALMLLPTVVAMPVIWRWSFWLLAWALFLWVVFSLYPISGLPGETRFVASLLLVLLFIGVCRGTAYLQWKAEKAQVSEGDLFLPSQNAAGTPVYIGEGGGPLPVLANEGEIFADAKLTLENKAGRILVSTVVRDQQGNEIVTIEKNHWSVTPFCKDKNYTRDSLEVTDRRGHVVFQMRLYPDHVTLQGDWFNDRGQGVLIVFNRKENNVSQVIYRCPVYDRHLDAIMIEPIFKYPSSRHWAEWLTVDRSSLSSEYWNVQAVRCTEQEQMARDAEFKNIDLKLNLPPGGASPLASLFEVTNNGDIDISSYVLWCTVNELMFDKTIVMRHSAKNRSLSRIALSSRIPLAKGGGSNSAPCLDKLTNWYDFKCADVIVTLKYTLAVGNPNEWFTKEVRFATGNNNGLFNWYSKNPKDPQLYCMELKPMQPARWNDTKPPS
jgi:hypothetical protein